MNTLKESALKANSKHWFKTSFLLSEGTGGQLREDKECPFSGVTNSGRVWRKVPESDAWSVH